MDHRDIHPGRVRVILLALLLGLALSACRGGPMQSAAEQDTPAQGPVLAPAGSAPALDSCTLLTQADAEALLGAPVAAPSTNQVDTGDPNDARAVSQCLYHTTGDTYKSVNVLVRRGAAGESAGAGLEQIREPNTLGGAFEPIAGLGDEALWNHSGAGDQLTVAQGQFLVIATADLGKGVPTLEVSKAIAQRVLARLP
jgi:hypothetical protein